MKPLLHLDMFSTPNRLLDDLIKESTEARLSSLERLLKEAQLPIIRITCYKYNRLEADCLIALSQTLDLFLYTHIRKVLERKATVISLPPSATDIREMFVRLRINQQVFHHYSLKELFSSKSFQEASPTSLPITFGLNAKEAEVFTLQKIVPIWIEETNKEATKDVIYPILCSLLLKNTPDNIKIIWIDPILEKEQLFIRQLITPYAPLGEKDETYSCVSTPEGIKNAFHFLEKEKERRINTSIANSFGLKRKTIKAYKESPTIIVFVCHLDQIAHCHTETLERLMGTCSSTRIFPFITSMTNKRKKIFDKIKYHIHFPPTYENSVQETLYQPREGNVFIHKKTSIVNTTLLTPSYVEEELQRITSNFDK